MIREVDLRASETRELRREVRRNRRHMLQAKRAGRQLDLRVLPDGRDIWYVPADLVAKVGCMAAVVSL